MDDNRWVIYTAQIGHNHVLMPGYSNFMGRSTELSMSVKKSIEINDAAMVPLGQSISTIIQHGGGYENCLYSARKLKNYADSLRRHKLGDGHAKALMDFLERKNNAGGNFFSKVQTDEAGCLKNVFWADGRSRLDYKYFGDVMTFDTTYLTNKYSMPFAPFVGVNNFRQSILFGCILICDETIETYEWLFTQFLECMSGKIPNPILTEQCASICGAIKSKFPTAHHRYCLWHILQNLPQKLGGIKNKDEITEEITTAVYESGNS